MAGAQITQALSAGETTLELKSLSTGYAFARGDIIFAGETIFREAKRDKKEVNNHLIHLFIHSVLHLLGYNHQTHDKARIMERLEIKILETLKIDNPYE